MGAARPQRSVTAASMSEQQIMVFTDGASKGNPGPGGWGVIIVTPDGHVTELGGGAAVTTNNKMELTGAIEALSQPAGHARSRVDLYGLHLRHPGDRRLGARLEASRLEDGRRHRRVEPGLMGAAGRPRVGPRPARARVALRSRPRGHSRERAGRRDRRLVRRAEARRAVRRPAVRLPVPILDLPDDTTVPPRSKPSSGGSTSKAAAYSYLSVVDGKPMRHATWSECERRVKGRSGARFKKATSAADEETILRSWGLEPDDV